MRPTAGGIFATWPGPLATVSGATIREVQSGLGHASPAAAYRYQHVLDPRDAQIAERLDVIFRADAGSEANPRPLTETG